MDSTPVSNAWVTFVRQSGARMSPDSVTMLTDAAGVFRVSAIPRDSASVTGTLRIAFANAHRDTVPGSVSLRATQDDTLRLLATYYVRRLP